MKHDITPEWLRAVGIYRHGDEGEPTEFGVRIRGGDDTGWKRSSDDDCPTDEIAELVISYGDDPERETVDVYVETYVERGGRTVAVIDLGSRATRGEILDLCRALKAWAIKYPTEQVLPTRNLPEERP